MAERLRQLGIRSEQSRSTALLQLAIDLPAGNAMPQRVLIVDDDDLMRAVLSSDETIEVVAEAADGYEAVEGTRATQPDVVLMNVRMPNLMASPRSEESIRGTGYKDSGADHVRGRRLHIRCLQRRRLQLPAQAHPSPRSYSPPSTTIAGGEFAVIPVRHPYRDRPHGRGHPTSAADRRLRQLTPREREVFELVARGLSNAEIAAALVVEESTSKTHVKRILAKLDLRDRVLVVVVACEARLDSPVSWRQAAVHEHAILGAVTAAIALHVRRPPDRDRLRTASGVTEG